MIPKTVAGASVILILLTGCISSVHRLNKLYNGMTKGETIRIMGTPNTTISPGNGVEILTYRLSQARPPLKFSIVEDYWVKLVGGKVDSYGKKGDFDSTKDPTLNLNVRPR
jgi:hypothetical protein